MFDMFRGMGALGGLMGKLPQIQAEMEKFRQNVGQFMAEGDAGAGMVKVRVNGRMEVLAVQISEDLWQVNDREMLEDLVKAATNQAIEKVKQLIQEETSKMAAGLGLPPGMNLPGLS